MLVYLLHLLSAVILILERKSITRFSFPVVFLHPRWNPLKNISKASETRKRSAKSLANTAALVDGNDREFIRWKLNYYPLRKALAPV